MDTIYLVRHGESVWNAEHKHQGWAEVPLSELGMKQATALGKRLAGTKIDLIFSSTLRRAVQTSELIAKGAGVQAALVTDPDLRDARRSASREGSSGYTSEEIQTVRANLDYKFPDGESSREFIARTLAVFSRIEQRLTGNSTFMVVTHGMNVKTLLLHALGLMGEVERNPFYLNALLRTNNAGLTTLTHDLSWATQGGTYRLLGFNDTGHLDLAGLETKLTTHGTEP